jgi:hypothetical protein
MTIQVSADDNQFITNLRLRLAKGSDNPPTLEEMKRAILILRSGRRLAKDANEASGKPKAKKPSAADVASALDDLESMC